MKETPNQYLERIRRMDWNYEQFHASCIGTNNGWFALRHEGSYLRMLVSDGSETVEEERWEHVSVSLGAVKRLPTWKEMCFVKDLFWKPEETVVQFHPPKSEYVNCHPYTLHLWRPLHIQIRTPPQILIGPM